MFFTDYNFFKITLNDPASPLMYGIIELHDHIFFFLNMVLFVVLFLLFTTLNFFTYKKNSVLNRYLLSESTKFKYNWIRLSHGTTIEIIWTIVPSLILILIAIPSFALLYATDEIIDPAVTIQVIGHQWYWSYEYNDLALAIPTEVKLPPTIYTSMDLPTLISLFGKFRDFNSFNTTNINDPITMVLGPRSEEFAPDIFNRSIISKYSRMLSYQAQVSIMLAGFAKKEGLLTVYDLLSYLSKPKVEFVSGSIEFDSYMRQESDLAIGEKRLYETDFPLVLPKNTHIRFMITADDVIHSWSVPALGIKVDAVPGRINQAHTFIKRSGTFYGQCSELCGVNHAFMPIQILVFEPSMYYDYLRLMLLNK